MVAPTCPRTVPRPKSRSPVTFLACTRACGARRRRTHTQVHALAERPGARALRAPEQVAMQGTGDGFAALDGRAAALERADPALLVSELGGLVNLYASPLAQLLLPPPPPPPATTPIPPPCPAPRPALPPPCPAKATPPPCPAKAPVVFALLHSAHSLLSIPFLLHLPALHRSLSFMNFPSSFCVSSPPLASPAGPKCAIAHQPRLLIPCCLRRGHLMVLSGRRSARPIAPSLPPTVSPHLS